MNRTPYIAPEQRDGYNAPIIDVNAGTAPKNEPDWFDSTKPAEEAKPAAKAPAKRKAK